MANLIVAQLLYLDSVDPKRDITMYINSPGGSVTAGRHHITCVVLSVVIPTTIWCVVTTCVSLAKPTTLRCGVPSVHLTINRNDMRVAA